MSSDITVFNSHVEVGPSRRTLQPSAAVVAAACVPAALAAAEDPGTTGAAALQPR